MPRKGYHEDIDDEDIDDEDIDDEDIDDEDTDDEDEDGEDEGDIDPDLEDTESVGPLEAPLEWRAPNAMNKALKLNAVKDISIFQARFLFDTRNQIMRPRIRLKQQSDSLGPNEFKDLLDAMSEYLETLENDCLWALNKFVYAHTVGLWQVSNFGVDFKTAAPLMALLDIRKANNASNFFRFCGCDPTSKWVGRKKAKQLIAEVLKGKKPTEDHIRKLALEIGRKPDKLRESAEYGRGPITHNSLREALAGFAAASRINSVIQKYVPDNAETIQQSAARDVIKELGLRGYQAGAAAKRAKTRGKMTVDSLRAALSRRPWNQTLKNNLYNIGCSFIINKKSPKCYYGHHLIERWDYEKEMNESGKLAKAAENALRTKKFKKPAVIKILKSGKLPKGHILARARRWTVKLYLSHLHQVMFEDFHRDDETTKKKYTPYILEDSHGNHNHYIPPPNWPMEGGNVGRSLKSLYGMAEKGVQVKV